MKHDNPDTHITPKITSSEWNSPISAYALVTNTGTFLLDCAKGMGPFTVCVWPVADSLLTALALLMLQRIFGFDQTLIEIEHPTLRQYRAKRIKTRPASTELVAYQPQHLNWRCVIRALLSFGYKKNRTGRQSHLSHLQSQTVSLNTSTISTIQHTETLNMSLPSCTNISDLNWFHG